MPARDNYVNGLRHNVEILRHYDKKAFRRRTYVDIRQNGFSFRLNEKLPSISPTVINMYSQSSKFSDNDTLTTNILRFCSAF